MQWRDNGAQVRDELRQRITGTARMRASLTPRVDHAPQGVHQSLVVSYRLPRAVRNHAGWTVRHSQDVYSASGCPRSERAILLASRGWAAPCPEGRHQGPFG
jgi:hypothetical protein